MRRLYFDHNATCPLRVEARQAIDAVLGGAPPGNPSSAHAEGRAARRLLEGAREDLAAVFDCHRDQIVFTSGGSEANALALTAAAAGRPALASPIEHPSVLRHPGVAAIPVNERGEVELEGRDLSGAGLISVAVANHEVGTVPDLGLVVELAHRAGLAVHADACQALGRLPLSFQDLGIDLMTLSGHKIGAPVGIGALVVGADVQVRPLVTGGEQEDGRRAGTEAVLLAVAFAAAARTAHIERKTSAARYRVWAHELYSYIRSVDDSVILNSPATGGLPNTLNVSFPGRPGAALVHRLDLEGVAVSHGSACASGSLQPSPVLIALGSGEERAHSAVRFSFGPSNTDDDVMQLRSRLQCVLQAIRPRTARPFLQTGCIDDEGR